MAHPTEYHSPLEARIAQSLAYSFAHNPRGLEGMWHTPWNYTFSKLLEHLRGTFLVEDHKQIWVSGTRMEESKLREAFKKAGLRYDSDGETSEEEVDVEEPPPSAAKGSKLVDKPVDIIVTRTESGSTRVAEYKKGQTESARKGHKSLVEDLHRRRKELQEKQRQSIRVNTTGTNDPDISINTVSSEPDGQAFDDVPDIVIIHARVAQLLRPVTPKLHSHFTHRAGIKTYHSCLPLILEIKPTGRHAMGTAYRRHINSVLTHAISDLKEYCAVYFETYRSAESVVTIAAAGPYWRWTSFKRKEVPPRDFVTNEAMPDPLYLEHKFSKKFGLKLFTLSTPASDKELLDLFHSHIYPMATDNHLPFPSFPESLQNTVVDEED